MRLAVISACCYGLMTVSFVNAGHVYLMPAISSDLGLSDAQTGALGSVMFWGMVASILFAGPLADRIGLRITLVMCSLSQFAGLILISRADTVLSTVTGMLIASTGTGGMLTMAWPIGFRLYPESRAAIANVLGSFCSVGAVTIVVVGILCLQADWTWRQRYVLSAFMMLPYGLAFAILPLPIVTTGSRKWWPVLGAPDRRTLITLLILLVTIFVMLIVMVGVGCWLPSFMTKIALAKEEMIGVAIILCAGSAALGNWIAAALVRRAGVTRIVTVGAILAVAALIGLSVFTGQWLLIGCFAALAFGMACHPQAVLGIVGDRLPDAGVSTYSLFHASGNAGCAVGFWLVGAMASLWTLPTTMAILTIGPVMSVIMLLIVLKRK